MPRNPIKQRVEKREMLENEWYSLRHTFSYWYLMFFILLGSREVGKSYSVTQFFIKKYVEDGIPFIWIRLTDRQANKLLTNNAKKLIDPDIRRKYGIDTITCGNDVYEVKRERCEVNHKDGTVTYENKIVSKKLMARVYAANTFYNDKGSIFDKDFLSDPKMYYHIGIDEFEREKGEKNTFDILYAVVNQLENLIRSTKDRVRIYFIGNTLEEASDILCAFGFIPEKPGRYQLVKNRKKLIQYLTELRKAKTDKEKKLVNAKYYNVDFGKRAYIESIENSMSYKIRRKGTVSDILMPTASTFTNEITTDNVKLFTGCLNHPDYIIKFTKDKNSWFTVWDGNVVAPYKGEKKPARAMRPYIDELFSVDIQKSIIQTFDTRSYIFRNLITFKKFQSELELLKPRK